MYSNIGLSYDLEFSKEKEPVDVDENTEEDLLAYDQTDWDQDGVIDAVYYYTYDIGGNEIKVEIDSDNDGVVDEVCCYNMEIAKK